jgi:HD-GYP domain-containing protein (c-di-GMP phosphodiesterase class II)
MDKNEPRAARQKEILVELSKQSNTDQLFDAILKRAQGITGAEGGTLYLLVGEGGDRQLDFAVVHNRKLGLHQGGVSGNPVALHSVPLFDSSGAPNHANVASFSALTGKLVNISDAYDDERFDFTGTKAFDLETNYRSSSFLTVPLLNHDDEVIGVLQLVNALDPESGAVIPFSVQVEPIVGGLASYAALALDNQILLEDHTRLLDAFIQTIAKAIDAKSPHTSLHCQRVPVLTELIAEAVCEDQERFAPFDLDADGWYELRVASWLHDCGKLSTPDSILDKSTKLHTMRDGIETVNARFTALMRETELACLRKGGKGPDGTLPAEVQLQRDLSEIEADRRFIEMVNRGAEALPEGAEARILDISKRSWLDHTGEARPLLTAEDVHNLLVSRGTLTDEERGLINRHIEVTIDMLESLPFPRKLRQVAEYAGGHHEKVNGSGFPKGLTGDQMSVPARIMAIADVFEALTSRDRPYKDPMPMSQALSILKRMRDAEHIDADLYHVFVKSRVWEKYGKTALNPDQLDVDDPESYL